MEALKLSFNHIDLSKISVCFTWDDNCFAHSALIAPEFSRRGLKCTFYINPGDEGFEKYAPCYKALLEASFETGSHGFNHYSLSGLTEEEALYQVKTAADGIYGRFGVYPATFAFPYHDFSGQTLELVKRFHLETRNTLPGAERFGVRTASTADAMCGFISGCVADGRNVVFSGHSAIADIKDRDAEESGYEPIILGNLEAVLDHIETLRDRAEVLTFEQAALKEYIRQNCVTDGGYCVLSREQADYLGTFHIDGQRLGRLL